MCVIQVADRRTYVNSNTHVRAHTRTHTHTHTGSQFQLAAGLLICVIQVVVHVRMMPFNTPAKNLIQFIGMAVSALIAFTGLVLNYLKVSQDKARLAGQVFQEMRLGWQSDAVRMALSVITIGSFAIAIVIQAIKMGARIYKKGSKIAKKVRTGSKFVRRSTPRSTAMPSVGLDGVEMPERLLAGNPGLPNSFSMENPLQQPGSVESNDSSVAVSQMAINSSTTADARPMRESGEGSGIGDDATLATSSARHESKDLT